MTMNFLSILTSQKGTIIKYQKLSLVKFLFSIKTCWGTSYILCWIKFNDSLVTKGDHKPLGHNFTKLQTSSQNMCRKRILQRTHFNKRFLRTLKIRFLFSHSYINSDYFDIFHGGKLPFSIKNSDHRVCWNKSITGNLFFGCVGLCC